LGLCVPALPLIGGSETPEWATLHLAYCYDSDQTSIPRFIEDNWLEGQRIPGSFDALAGTLTSMFDFKRPADAGEFLLNPSTREPIHGGHPSGW
jgi:phospholipase C